MRNQALAFAPLALLAFALPAPRAAAPFTVKTDDGYTITGDLQVPKRKEGKAPLVVMIHDAEGKRALYAEAAGKFYRSGFAVVTFDMRGHGDSAKKDGKEIELKDEMYKLMRRDLAAILKHCGEQDGIDAETQIVIGAGFGATLALKHAANDDAAKIVVALSPQLADSRTKEDNSKPMEKLSGRPIMIVIGKLPDDKENATRLEYYVKQKGGKLEIKTLPNDNRGADLFTVKPGLADEIISWVKKSGVDPMKKPEAPKK